MSHLPPRVQQSDCLSAEERGLRGGIPSLWKEVQVGAEQEEEEEEENGEWDDSWRREICSFIRVGQAGQLLPLTSRTSERPTPSRTKGLLFLFPLAAFLPLPLPLLFFFFHTFSLIATLQDQDMTWRNKVLQVCKRKKKVQWCGVSGPETQQTSMCLSHRISCESVPFTDGWRMMESDGWKAHFLNRAPDDTLLRHFIAKYLNGAILWLHKHQIFTLF